ncbi:MAG: sensor histidine kinase, partial [Anaerolineales bacterium]
FSAVFDINCLVRVTGRSQRLPKESEFAIYRIIQAALDNVATHAQASQVWVDFDFGREQLYVIVHDDGVGFHPSVTMTTPGDHLGLIGMKERAEGLGADLKVNSKPGKGTRIELMLPSPAYLGEL